MIRMSGLIRGALACLLFMAMPAWATCDDGNENTAITSTTPAIDFVDHGNGTVTHVITGLMWKRCSEGQDWNDVTCTGEASTFYWQDALNHADVIPAFADHDDWRLPNRNELASLVEESCWSPSINVVIFPETPAEPFWSSSPYLTSYPSAWYVEFGDGSVGPSNGGIGRIRLVRKGQ